MANLGFLEDSKTVSTSNVSTGNKPAQQPTKDINYDFNKGRMETTLEIPLETEYVQRAIKAAEAAGFTVVESLKQALIDRANGKMVMTYREADIMLRHGYAESGAMPAMIVACLYQFDGFLHEENERFDRGVFVFRARYNKGIEWFKKFSVKASETDRQKAHDTLREIADGLSSLSLPLHQEETTDGFHREFLKPDHLTWTQFNDLIREAQKTRTMMEKETLVKGAK